MSMFPARLARKVTIAATREEARVRVIDAYRAWYRSAPEICALYALNVSPSALRLKFRQDFEKNRNIDDLAVINVLLHKNQQEYQETMNCWKQEPHLLHWFKQYEDPAKPVSFLDKFYSGRDDPKQVASF
ncbi:ndufa6 NADH-ubiquinone oxidoreductase subunit [Vanrija albida]|uniref:Ndufa6 NADH-ubiquinone oxidoreductase subunit n=1 Tax=Vanrija albida TaxID=181172 RepID=A0ABR3Q495_9TREE